ncbi:MAG: hypothetical protein FWE03_06710 [Firmicutes bacterium]|nr:hypothetical protein [Bacillota bacterium]
MKKRISILIAIMMLLVSMFMFNACIDNLPPDQLPSSVTIYVPDGPPLLALANIYTESSKVQGVDIEVYRTTGPLIGGHLIAGRPDFALVPMNLAATRFNTDGEYILAGVALWGLLHIIENTNHSDGNYATSLNDLVGQTIIAYQRNMSPGIVLETILRENGLTVNWMTAADDVNPNAVNIIALADNAAANTAIMGNNAAWPDARFALLAEPVASMRESENNFRRAFDLQDEWAAAFEDEDFDARIPQVGVVVRSSLANYHPAFVNEVLSLIEGSISFVRENPNQAADLIINQLESVYMPNSVAVVTNFLNTTGQYVYEFMSAGEAKAAILHFLNILYAINPAFIGGSVPSSDFFFAQMSARPPIPPSC